VDTAREKPASFSYLQDVSLGLIVISNMLGVTETEIGGDQDRGAERGDTVMTAMMIEKVTARMMNMKEGNGSGKEGKKRKRNISEGS